MFIGGCDEETSDDVGSGGCNDVASCRLWTCGRPRRAGFRVGILVLLGSLSVCVRRYYGYAPVAGAIKLDTKVKDAAVYIDGAYAGTAGKLKTMYLRPGSYDVEVRSPGGAQFDQKLYVTAGKTLHVNPNLAQSQPKP